MPAIRVRLHDPRPRKPGLGDRVEKVAKPIAKGLKKVTRGRVDLTNCGGCKKRKDWLNRLSR